jgi:DNA-3-methyladenine glycosylase
LVYLTYGIHYMLNAVTRGAGEPFCVLLRALEPLEGLEFDSRGSTRGPGLLTRALGVDLRYNGGHLSTGWLRILEGGLGAQESAAVTTRVGVEGAGPEAAGQPWRFLVADNGYVSRGRPSTPERAALVVAERAARREARRAAR